VQGAHEVRGSAAVAATDLQHPLAAEIHLGRRTVVELDAEPVGLVGLRQRQGHRWILLIAEVEKHHVIVAVVAGVVAGEEGERVLRHACHNERAEYKAVDERVVYEAAEDRHGVSMTDEDAEPTQRSRHAVPPPRPRSLP
jgi:hypothetical protein